MDWGVADKFTINFGLFCRRQKAMDKFTITLVSYVEVNINYVYRSSLLIINILSFLSHNRSSLEKIVFICLSLFLFFKISILSFNCPFHHSFCNPLLENNIENNYWNNRNH